MVCHPYPIPENNKSILLSRMLAVQSQHVVCALFGCIEISLSLLSELVCHRHLLKLLCERLSCVLIIFANFGPIGLRRAPVILPENSPSSRFLSNNRSMNSSPYVSSTRKKISYLAVYPTLTYSDALVH